MGRRGQLRDRPITGDRASDECDHAEPCGRSQSPASDRNATAAVTVLARFPWESPFTVGPATGVESRAPEAVTRNTPAALLLVGGSVHGDFHDDDDYSQCADAQSGKRSGVPGEVVAEGQPAEQGKGRHRQAQSQPVGGCFGKYSERTAC